MFNTQLEPVPVMTYIKSLAKPVTFYWHNSNLTEMSLIIMTDTEHM